MPSQERFSETAAHRDIYERGRKQGRTEMLEMACKAVCIHCARNAPVEKVEEELYRHTKLSYAQNLCDAWPIRAAAEKECRK